MRSPAAGPDVPEPDYDDPKELYAFFGLAAYCAGLLELSLVNLLAAVRLHDPSLVPALHADAIFDELHQRTFGNLLFRTRQLVPLDPSTLDLLDVARDKRNYLVHHFFRVHADTALHPDGVRRMIDELRELALHFRSADQVADPLWRDAWRVLGLGEDMIEAEVERVRAEMSARG